MEVRIPVKKKPMMRKEFSLDTYTWQKKYGRLLSRELPRLGSTSSLDEVTTVGQEDPGKVASNFLPSMFPSYFAIYLFIYIVVDHLEPSM